MLIRVCYIVKMMKSENLRTPSETAHVLCMRKIFLSDYLVMLILLILLNLFFFKTK